jgi:hypothetical protein
MANEHENTAKYISSFETIKELIEFYFMEKYKSDALENIAEFRYIEAIDEIQEMEETIKEGL